MGKRTSLKRPMIALQLQLPKPLTMLHHHQQPSNYRHAPALLPTLLLKRGAGKGKETVLRRQKGGLAVSKMAQKRGQKTWNKKSKNKETEAVKGQIPDDEELKRVTHAILGKTFLKELTKKTVRRSMEKELGLGDGALDHRKGVINEWVDEPLMTL